MSISRNVGALSRYLGRVVSGSFYNRFRYRFKSRLVRRPKLFQLVRRIVYRIKRLLMPPGGNFFETLGLRYIGPVDGHDLKKLISVLTNLKESGGPVVLHVVTSKGAGCSFAEADPTRYHGIAGCDPENGTLPESTPGFSKAFGSAMVKLGEIDQEIVAVSAAMLEGTGLKNFAEKFPGRTFDTGIAEEHAVTFASSLAANGKRPVCAIYDTFLQRALDGIYHDGVLAQVPLVIAADRAGAVEDGATHHGIYNCSFLRSIPGLTVMAPATCGEVEKYLKFALNLKHPAVIRYPRGGVKPYEFPEFPELEPGKAAIMRQSNDENPVVIWSFGAELVTALETADILEKSGIFATVINARFLKPFDKALARSLVKFRQYTIENHSISGGLYSALTESCAGIAHAPITGFGWPDDEIIGHGEVGKLREKYGLTAAAIAGKICTGYTDIP
jgi:1-deoxy-D-xylulose-5-phosphate synthase